MRDIIPACGGTEPVSVINGKRWQYIYEPSTGRHGYHDIDNDLITWHRSFHPATRPELELCVETPLSEREEAYRMPRLEPEPEPSLFW